MENNHNQKYVRVRRDLQKRTSAEEYPIADIRNIKWDNISGGIHIRQAVWSLYGYIPYENADKLDLNSGRHNWGYNDTKICICASDNKEEPYLSTYKELCDKAGTKPLSKIALNRPKGEPPCTKKICALLNQQEYMLRKNLRSELIDTGYPITTIRSAIKRLERNNKITIEESPNSDNQKISLCV